jgi:hypothetical protein
MYQISIYHFLVHDKSVRDLSVTEISLKGTNRVRLMIRRRFRRERQEANPLHKLKNDFKILKEILNIWGTPDTVQL